MAAGAATAIERTSPSIRTGRASIPAPNIIASMQLLLGSVIS
jgi:hypothetical protein